MAAPIEQTFVSQPAIIPPMQVLGTTQYYPESLGTTFPTTNFPPQMGVISSGQIGDPIISNMSNPIISNMSDPIISYPTGPIISSVVEPADNNSEAIDGSENDGVDQVQEGQIEGEIISPEDDSSASEMSGEIGELGKEDPAAKQDADPSTMQSNVDNIPLTPAKELAEQAQAEAEKAAKEAAAEEAAAKEQAAKEEAARIEAEQQKAKAAKLEADKKKAKAEAEKKKAAQEAKEKVVSDAEKITRLEASLKRQINRANQVSKRNLAKKLEQLKTDDASEAEITAAETEAAEALKKKIETIETRIQARIEKLKE